MSLFLEKLLLALYIVKRLFALLKARKDFNSYVPLLYTPIQPLSPLGVLLPKSRFYRVLGFNWDERRDLYENAPLKTVAIAPIIGADTRLFSSHLDTFYQGLCLNSDFHKEKRRFIDLLGENVVTTDGDTWKRHRRIVAPAFNHSTYKSVWDTTLRVYKDMLNKEGWHSIDRTGVTDICKATHKVALFLIAIVGFGIPMTWDEPPRNKNEKPLAQNMVLGVAEYAVARNSIPKWAYHLGIERLSQIEEIFNRFDEFMHERIAEREAELMKLRDMDGREAKLSGGLNDLIGRLLNSRLSEGKHSLSDSEFIGNCFAFIFAGHKTTANTLAATLGLLALYQDEQERVYRSIMGVIGEREPAFDDFDKLDCVLACFFEGVRLYPGAYLIVRVASKDTVLSLSRKDNPEVKEIIPVKEGTRLILDIVGMCYDPQTFPDPEAFNPRRWKRSGKTSTSTSTTKAMQADEITGSSPSTTFEGFLGFAYGPRTCLGHKFAKVEAVAFLTMLLREWRIEAVMREGETKQDWRERVLKPSFGQALLIGEVPIRLVRRK